MRPHSRSRCGRRRQRAAAAVDHPAARSRKREVDVLGVEANTPSSRPRDVVPGLAAVRAGGTGRADQDRDRRLCAFVCRRAREGADNPRASDRRPGRSSRCAPRPGISRRDGTEPRRSSSANGATRRSRKSGRHSTSLLSRTTMSPLPACDASIARRREAEVRSELEQPCIGKRSREAARAFRRSSRCRRR